MHFKKRSRWNHLKIWHKFSNVGRETDMHYQMYNNTLNVLNIHCTVNIFHDYLKKLCSFFHFFFYGDCKISNDGDYICVHLFLMNYFPEVHNSDCYMFIYFENLNPYLYVLPYIYKNHLFKCTLNLLHINQTV